MYCPHCGAQNAQETKFCRACGEDLRLVSQAVTKSLPLVIAHRVDEAIDRGRDGWRSYQLFRTENRRAYSQLLFGLATLFVVVWVLMLGHGSVSFASGFLLVMALAMLATSIQDILTRRRGRREERGREQAELPSPLSTKELPPSYDAPRVSVTESTTRELKVKARRGPRGEGLR